MIEQKPPDHQLQSQEFYFLPPHLTASPLPKYSPITLRQQSFPSFHPLFTALRLCLGLLNLSSLSRLSPISTFPMLSSAIWAPEFPLYLKSLVATFYGYKHVTLQRWGPKLMQLLCPFWNPALISHCESQGTQKGMSHHKRRQCRCPAMSWTWVQDFRIKCLHSLLI